MLITAKMVSAIMISQRKRKEALLTLNVYSFTSPGSRYLQAPKPVCLHHPQYTCHQQSDFRRFHLCLRQIQLRPHAISVPVCRASGTACCSALSRQLVFRHPAHLQRIAEAMVKRVQRDRFISASAAMVEKMTRATITSLGVPVLCV
ncbi:hypothetical protein KIF59_19540 [Enterobacter cloacae subsp. cloacae]|nr:hypothetical protein [Enterobacter cloacae subsp. cloacae]